MTEHEHGEGCRCDPILNEVVRGAVGPNPGDVWTEEARQGLLGQRVNLGSLKGEVTRVRSDGMIEVTFRGEIPSDCVTISVVEHLSIAEGGEDVGFVKHGTGEVIPEPEDSKKTASENWSDKDREELAQENQEK